jgi:hypothetical protein
MKKLTMKQIEALQLVKERHIGGDCYRCVWRFTDGNNTYTSQVRALERAGLVNVMYFENNECAVNLTDAGRAIA